MNSSFAPSSFSVLTNTFTLNDQTTFSDWTLSDENPTAAAVNIGGRVLRQDGRPVSKAIVKMTNSVGEVRYAMTNPFGFYHFVEVAVGETYIFSIRHKSHQFTPRAITINEARDDINFIADPEQ